MDQTVELTKRERRKVKRKRRRKRLRRIVLFGLLIFFLFGTRRGESTVDHLRQIDGGDVKYTLSQGLTWIREIFPGIRTRIAEFLDYIANFI